MKRSNVTIREEDLAYCKEHELTLSEILRRGIDAHRNGDHTESYIKALKTNQSYMKRIIVNLCNRLQRAIPEAKYREYIELLNSEGIDLARIL